MNKKRCANVIIGKMKLQAKYQAISFFEHLKILPQVGQVSSRKNSSCTREEIANYDGEQVGKVPYSGAEGKVNHLEFIHMYKNTQKCFSLHH